MKRTQNHIGKRPKRYAYIKSATGGRERNIILKEESLYKPLLVTFFIFLVAMVILFPTSILDKEFPAVMEQLRHLFGLMSLSAVATLLILPVSFLDLELLRIFSRADIYTNLYVIFIILFAVSSDTMFAYIGYKFTKTLRKLFASRAKKADIQKSNEKLQKYGNLGMFFFSCTPLPFTLAIYTAGAVRLRRKWFLIAVFAGRTVKYSAFALFLRLFEINLVQLGENLFQVIFG
jgi:membrane protein YqaA with SNARE-associated domain